MRLRNKVLSVVGVVLFSALVPVAQVAAQDVWVVVYSGATTPGGLTPVQTVGGSGTYAFDTSAGLPVVGGRCSVAITHGHPVPTVSVDPSCVLSAVGSYANVVCGTGTTGSTSLGVAEGDSATLTGVVSSTFNYGIVFVAGVGVEHGTGNPASAGVVILTPTGGSCASAVTTFVATGASLITDAA